MVLASNQLGCVNSFEKLPKEGIDHAKFVKPLSWKNLFQINETHYFEVVTNFYFMVEAFPDKPRHLQHQRERYANL